MPSDQPSPQIIIQQKESMFGRYGKFLIAGLVLAIMVIIGMRTAYQSYFNEAGGPQERYLHGERFAQKKIAVIKVSGTISEADTFVKEQIDRVAKDDQVVAVVLRINSPGGTVTYSDYLHHKLRQLATGEIRQGAGKDQPLPIVVSMGSLCASGGYYIASAVGDTPDSIFAEPATITGSIGVIIPHYDLSGLLANWSIENDSIATHPLKEILSMTKEMTEEQREILQTLVDEMLDDFKDKIKAGRPVFQEHPQDLDEIATGQIFSTDQAIELKLVDKKGYLEDAMARAAELGGTDLQNVRCVDYKRAPSAFDALTGNAKIESKADPMSIQTLQNMATPRAYFLYGGLPGLEAIE
ncbi:Putative signal peptide peptidase SppA [Aeoliella mucimassa]|uniref:Signal peptide peptidase SppA n=2 Tax=Aeoliella mucimassa TaxID=2527972 RepID=A0A518AHR4_9BACT|nr:Putative signal peptide peptidase SppA [Aeoliella mucimassa]